MGTALKKIDARVLESWTQPWRITYDNVIWNPPGHTSKEEHMLGRTLWINNGDVAGSIEPGNVVKATRSLGCIPAVW